MKKIIGLTGGIATGKSAVTSILRALGFVVIDADAVVHELQEPGGKLYQAIVREFGPGFFDASGNLNREKLASLVFQNEEAYERLSKLQNQIIRKELERRRSEEIKNSEQSFFMDIPLLLEEHYEALFDEVWLVTVPEEIQMKRLMARSNLTEEEARERINRQMPMSEKLLKADVILDNSTTLSDLKLQVLLQLKQL
ncbi:MAG: dephospho-CoA kinase [Streptococcaceae bacterium]|jgi:dephospho-CoA kinase|nr:dephospho-CoA kinase [Streptococcaceae bacterium]